MKTAEQIDHYLRTLPVYEVYKENISETDKETYLSGEMGESTFTEAFCWAETPQGYMFWHEVNNEFMTWFNEE